MFLVIALLLLALARTLGARATLAVGLALLVLFVL
jgi:hypothetical protein